MLTHVKNARASVHKVSWYAALHPSFNFPQQVSKLGWQSFRHKCEVTARTWARQRERNVSSRAAHPRLLRNLRSDNRRKLGVEQPEKTRGRLLQALLRAALCRATNSTHSTFPPLLPATASTEERFNKTIKSLRNLFVTSANLQITPSRNLRSNMLWNHRGGGRARLRIRCS